MSSERRVLRVALATCEQFPGIDSDDQHFVDAAKDETLASELHFQFEFTPCMWTDPDVDWTAFDAVLLRATWDYHTRLDEFLAWVGKLEEAKVLLLNPASIVRFNCNKLYLRMMEQAGVTVPPSEWLLREDGGGARVRALLEKRGWDKAVLKPVVSAGASDTLLVRSDEPDSVRKAQALVDRMYAGETPYSGLTLQQFVAEISDPGECSLLFFDGKFSHALVKKPKKGDFRCQEHYGGRNTLIKDVSRAMLSAARRCVAALPAECLYTRVDMIDSEELGPVLMEVEAIEPTFYLGVDESGEAAKRFVRALDAVIHSS